MTSDQQFTQIAIDLNDLINEVKMLKAENKSLDSEVKSYQKRVCSMCDGHGMVGNILDSMDCPDCVALHNKIKADAISEMFDRMPSQPFNKERDKNNWYGDYIQKLRGVNG